VRSGERYPRVLTYPNPAAWWTLFWGLDFPELRPVPMPSIPHLFLTAKLMRILATCELRIFFLVPRFLINTRKSIDRFFND
jgi:hypothetical protein